MHRFQHGIWLAFLRLVGACFGLPLKQEEEDESTAADDDLHKNEDGCLLPLSGEEEGFLPPALSGEDEDFADNLDLHEEGELLPESGEEHEGCLPPLQRGEEGYSQPIEREANRVVLQPQKGEEWGIFQPMNNEEDEDTFLKLTLEDDDAGIPPMLGINKANAFLQASIVSFQLHGMHVFCDAYSLKFIVITYMHASLWETPKACMVHDDVVIVHAKARVDPKVKKKTSLLLCLFIHMPFHPGEHGHDGIPPSCHHEPCSKPCSKPCLYIESLYSSLHSFANAPSSSNFSLLINISNEDKHAYEEIKVATTSIELPFIPLRGSKTCQARERQFQEKMMACTRSKTTKIRMTKMRLSYLMKDVLDPG